MLVRFTPSAATSARDAVRIDLAENAVGDEIQGDALLVMSELVTNAVRHGLPLAEEPDQLRVVWHIADRSIRVEVTDGGKRLPVQKEPSDRAEGGRGLAIVDALCCTWGVVHEATDTTVWARLVRTPASLTDPG